MYIIYIHTNIIYISLLEKIVKGQEIIPKTDKCISISIQNSQSLK